MKIFAMSMYANEKDLYKAKAEYFQKDYETVINTSRHYHVSNGQDDSCKQCGLDVRHEIHHGKN